MAITTWDENAPADSDSASSGDNELRLLKVSVREGVDASMYWPSGVGGSAASAGIMKPGAARVFYGAASAVSTANDGQLMYASDTSRLYHIGPSTGAMFLGSPFVVEHLQNAGTGSHWAMLSGIGNNGVTISFNQAYGATPMVVASAATTTAIAAVTTVSTSTTGGFVVSVYSTTSLSYAASTFSVHWMSIGTRDGA